MASFSLLLFLQLKWNNDLYTQTKLIHPTARKINKTYFRSKQLPFYSGICHLIDKWCYMLVWNGPKRHVLIITLKAIEENRPARKGGGDAGNSPLAGQIILKHCSFHFKPDFVL